VKIEFTIAGPGDDADIRRLVAENPVPGRVTVAFEREPDYFAGGSVMGDTTVIIGRNAETGELAGVITLSVSERWIGGRQERVGYLGQLRIRDRYQGMLLPMRAYPFIRSTAEELGLDLCFTAVMRENTTVRDIYVRHLRRTFPVLEPVTGLYTCGIIVRRGFARGGLVSGARGRRMPSGPGGPAGSSGQPPAGGISVTHATPNELPELVEFMNTCGAEREWSPVQSVENLAGDRYRGLAAADVVVARAGGRIVGTAGLWDQSAFKQSVIRGYPGRLGRVRPFYNGMARLVGFPPLPRPGDHMHSASLCCLAVEHDDPAVFGSMLPAVLRAARERGFHYVLVGLSDRDPLLPVARAHTHIAYHSSMYAFSFEQARDTLRWDREKIPHIEIAAL
jgi:hypothetical protein